MEHDGWAALYDEEGRCQFLLGFIHELLLGFVEGAGDVEHRGPDKF